jgi:hypothetical protein
VKQFTLDAFDLPFDDAAPSCPDQRYFNPGGQFTNSTVQLVERTASLQSGMILCDPPQHGEDGLAIVASAMGAATSTHNLPIACLLFQPIYAFPVHEPSCARMDIPPCNETAVVSES